MPKANARSPEDDDLVARAAWLHFVGGLTQSEVATRLGLSTTRAHRAIAKAQSSGIVHIAVKASASTCLELENTLTEMFGLSMCRVAMDIPERGPIPLKSLGAAGGEWLEQILSQGEHKVIGVSHGRTIAAVVENLWHTGATNTSFVSLLGGLTQSLAANPYDVIHRLAQKTGADAYLMPVPLFANSSNDKQVFLAQSMVTGAFDRMKEASLAFVGIGDLTTSNVAANGMPNSENAHLELSELGAKAEILGQFLDTQGRAISTSFDGRTMAMDLQDLRNREVVAIAGGKDKIEPVKAALNSGLITGLIIDEVTARVLVDRLKSDSAVAAE